MIHEFIKRHEGRRHRVYDDATGKDIVPGSHVVGHPSIGDGFALDVAGLDDEEIDWLRDRRITRATNAARRVFGDHFGDVSAMRQVALIAMAYQLGEAGLAGFKNMLAYARVGDWERASKEALDSQWFKQTPDRAFETAEMLRTGEWIG